MQTEYSQMKKKNSTEAFSSEKIIEQYKQSLTGKDK